MRIESVRIQNFRAFKDETVYFNKYTCLIGPNGSGKSTVLCALNVFFREARDVATNLQQLHEEDFHCRNTNEPVQITVTFVDLSAEAQETFKHYFRQGRLVVSAVAKYDPTKKCAPVEQHGERLVMPAFTEYFEAQAAGKLIADLRVIYAKIKQDFPALPAASTKGAMEAALRDYEEAHSEQCELIRSPANFYGVTKGENLLARYVEWIYVPAVKDPASEQVEGRNNVLGKLVARAVRSKVQLEDGLKGIRETAQARYQELLAANTEALNEFSGTLQTRVSQWAHPGAQVKLEWDQAVDSAVSIKEPLVRITASEGVFQGELPRFGHGLQRSYLLAILHELSRSKGTAEPTLILACEEPELYQHPPQARHLASVLLDLSESGSQIITSTHSPHFVAGEAFEDVRIVRKDQTGTAFVRGATFEEIAQRIGDALGQRPKQRAGMMALMHRTLRPSLSEIFFGDCVILVEGAEDAAFITSYVHLTEKWDEFRRRGVHIVPTNGKSLILEPLVILLQLQIPVFVVFDSDGHEQDPDKRATHARDNTAILKALGIANPDPFPDQIVLGDNFAQWPICLAAQIESDVGTEQWRRYQQAADREWGHAGGLRKNPLHIASCIKAALDDGIAIPTLHELCTRILR